ncbi:MAG: PEP-CTERM sorting domain-containing protein [Armatimonadetes bacterium]|nr:PEP-CTERM sorting domain-containing protein [Armatimonadota bacterium]GIK33269.1 MAG: hypothetical protein BroJett009_22610 [Armatimonadota bacterium]
MVGIWRDSDQALMASALVDPGTATTLGDWMYQSISPVQLSSGASYTAGAMYTATDSDSYVSNPTTVVTDPWITLTASVYPSTGSLGFVYPSLTNAGARGRHGPNFIVAAVPEPTTLIALGLGGMALARRRRAKR